MSQVIIAGDTSGTITLQAPAVSGSTTLTLPATTATLATLTTPSFLTTIGVGGTTASASGAGISFPATQSASSDANCLDDYEEGTWTPVGQFVTLINNNCVYVKVGRSVTVYIDVSWPTTSDTFNANINGLPFIVSSSGGLAVGYNTGLAGAIWWASGGSSIIACFNATNANMSGKRIIASLTYFTTA